MDESYRSRHRAEWERRRAAEQQAEATRRVETSGSAQSPPKDSSAQPATAGNAQIQQGQGTACPNTVNSSASSWPQAGWDGSQVALRSLGGMSQLACDASVPTACPNIDPDEVASLETARRLQAEFESVNEFPVDDGTRNTEEQLDDEEIARRLQETENRRASRLQQPLPRLRSESPQTDSHMQGSEAHVGQLPPRDLQEHDIDRNLRSPSGQSQSLTQQDSHATEIRQLPAAAPDVAAAAAAAGIQVDDDEAVLQAAIVQSLLDM